MKTVRDSKVLTGVRHLNTRAVTLTDVAKQCAVSAWTVSAALRGDARVKAETAERIRLAAAAIGYDPARQVAARRMLLSRHGLATINHVVATFYAAEWQGQNGYFAKMMQGILEALRPQRFGLLVIDIDSVDAEGRLSYPACCNRGEIDGLILFGHPSIERHLATMRALPSWDDRPAVSMISSLPACDGLWTDDRDGFRQATDHLANLGHRHILCLDNGVTNSSYFLATPRWEGVDLALRNHGLEPAIHRQFYQPPPEWLSPADLISNDGAADHTPGGDGGLLGWLRAHPEFTAIIAHNDPVAIHAIHVLRRAGVRVPEDISVIGCDDTNSLFDSTGRNQLTTLRMPLTELGRRSTELLLSRIEGHLADPDPTHLPVDLVVRGTTAKAPLSVDPTQRHSSIQ